MSYQISTSIVKLDLNFLLDNFFKPSLWKKTWTIFAYDKYEVTIKLSSIYPSSQLVYFEVQLLCKGQKVEYNSVYFNYDKGNRNLVANTNSLNGTVIRTIEQYEAKLIERSWAYKKADEANSIRAELYREAAKEKIEELKALKIGVINEFIEEISDSYIDKQVSKAYDYTRQNEIQKRNKGKLVKSLFLSYMSYAEMISRREEFIRESNFYAKPTSKMIGEILSELSKVKKIDFIDTVKADLDDFNI